MSETLSVGALIAQIKTSLDELERNPPVNDWERRRLRQRRRDHVVAFGVAELFSSVAEGLGAERARAFATHDAVGVRKMDYYEVVLEPVNPNAASIRAHIDWLGDSVTLYPGAGGRMSLWPSRKQSAEEFVVGVATYVDAIVTGGFRATYWIKRRGTPFTITLHKGEVISAKLEFRLDGKWRRCGEILPGAPGADKLDKTYEPY